jgi:hypothetical protein
MPPNPSTQQVLTFQSNFSVGEITPLMYGRIDLSQYYKGLKRATNVLQLPQGGFSRRFGLVYVDWIDQVTNFTEVRLANFEYSTTEQYVLVFLPLEIVIYENNGVVATVVTPYTASEIIELRFDQDLNQLIIVHQDVEPYQLSRGGNSATWTFSPLVFKNTPSYDFTNNYSNVIFTLASVSGQAAFLDANAPIFSAVYVGGTFSSIPGYAKITEYINPVRVRVNIYIDFGQTNVYGYEAILAEPAFSPTRGWPKCVAFYQSRLFFGGTKTLPQGLFGSVLNEYNNFLAGLGLPTDALILFLAGARLNSIQYLLNAVSLFIFTTGGVYATPPLTDQALTPTTARVDRQTSTGVQDNVPPYFIDNTVQYVQRGGRDVMTMQYNIGVGSYKTKSVALTAEHLIQNPVDTAKFEHTQQNQGTYSFFCNSDGTLAIYQTIDEEQIHSWTLSETNGLFRRAVGLDDTVYFLIERTIDGTPRLYLERIDFTVLMDSIINFTSVSPTATITGLSHLENETVGVVSNGNFLGEYVVSSGEVTVSTEIEAAEVGLVWHPEIITLPINFDLPSGNNVFIPKQIKQTYLQLYQSQAVFINNIRVDALIPGEYILGDPPKVLNGAFKLPTSFGMQWDQELVITQDIPAPFTLLSISYQVEL